MSHIILFVCTGNVCRSPMAAALFNARARQLGEADQFVARSAGTWTYEHQRASGHAITVMAERGINLSEHRAHTLTREDLANADVIICMTRSHREALSAEFPEYRPKLYLISELKNRVYDLSDPYGGVLSEYQKCAHELESLIDSGYEKIKAWISSQGVLKSS